MGGFPSFTEQIKLRKDFLCEKDSHDYHAFCAFNFSRTQAGRKKIGDYKNPSGVSIKDREISHSASEFSRGFFSEFSVRAFSSNFGKSPLAKIGKK